MRRRTPSDQDSDPVRPVLGTQNSNVHTFSESCFGTEGNAQSVQIDIYYPRDESNGETEDDGLPDRDRDGKCKDLPGSECQLKKLWENLQDAVNTGSRPPCGSDYQFWKVTDLVHFFDGFNSNTFVYNMIEQAGIKPPSQGFAP